MVLTLQNSFANMGVGAENTLVSGRAAPVSLAAFLCSKSFMGQMGLSYPQGRSLSVRTPAWLTTCFQHLSHPTLLKKNVVDIKNSVRSIQMSTSISTVAFHGANLTLVSIDSKPYAAIKSICDAIGLAWNAQFERIKRDAVLSSVIRVTRTTGSDGKKYEMLCLPLGYLNGWLLGVNANRVKPEIRQKLIQYQMECYDVLYQHFMPKVAKQSPNTINTQQQYWIKKAVSDLAYHSGRHHQSIYKQLYDVFQIPEYRDLPASRFDEAMLFLQSGGFSNRQISIIDTNSESQVIQFITMLDRKYYPAIVDLVIQHFKNVEKNYDILIGKQIEERKRAEEWVGPPSLGVAR